MTDHKLRDENDSYTSGSLTEVACTECAWTLPAGRNPNKGTQDRPSGADYCDEVMPLISAHIGATSHRVHVTLNTFSPGMRERSVLAFWPGRQEWVVDHEQYRAS